MGQTEENNSLQQVSRMGPLAWTPVVADSAARDALFPTPVGDEKVVNKGSGLIERYNAPTASWVNDFVPSALVGAGYVLYDDFSRPDTVAGSLGTSPSGHVWTLRAPYAGSYPLPISTKGQIRNKEFVGSDVGANAIYATTQLKNTGTLMGATVSWTPSTGSLTTSFAMGMSINSNQVSDMLHFIMGRSSWSLQLRGTAAGNGNTSGNFITIATGAISPVIATDGSKHSFWVSVAGNTATVSIDGALFSVTDTRIPYLIGPYIMYEHFYNSTPALDLLHVNAVWSGPSILATDPSSPPKLTTAARDALVAAPTGLLIYNTDANNLNFRSDSGWESARPSPASLLSYRPGDIVNGEVFTRNTNATYFDINGVLQTAAVNGKRDAHYIGGIRTLLMEGVRSNACLWNRDLTNAAWVASSITPLKDQTGIDGAATSASSLLATGANGTILQAITIGSSARFQSAYVKRITGSGTINMTMDNGATWTSIGAISTTAWTRVSIPTQTLANPTVGFQIVTSGDKIAVDYVQNEDSTFASMPIATTTALLTRGTDKYNFLAATGMIEQTAYVRFIDLGSSVQTSARVFQLGGTVDPLWRVVWSANGLFKSTNNTVNTANVAAGVVNDTLEIRAGVRATGVTYLGIAVNGGAETVSADSTAPTVAAYTTGVISLNQDSTLGGPGFAAYESFKLFFGTHALSAIKAA